MLSSLSHLVPGGCLHVRSLQLCLLRSWVRRDQSVRVPWSLDCLRDLRWWLHLPRLTLGVSLLQVSPDLDFWSDASDVGWGAHLGSLTASSLWTLDQATLSTPENCLPSKKVSSTSSPLWWGGMCLCSATTAPLCLTSARMGAPGLPSSTR